MLKVFPLSKQAKSALLIPSSEFQGQKHMEGKITVYGWDERPRSQKKILPGKLFSFTMDAYYCTPFFLLLNCHGRAIHLNQLT